MDFFASPLFDHPDVEDAGYHECEDAAESPPWILRQSCQSISIFLDFGGVIAVYGRG